MYCLQCGKEIPEGAKFCIYCGTAVPKRDEAKAPPVNDFQAEQGAAPVKRKGGTKGLLITAVIVIALLAFTALSGSFSGGTKGPKLVGTYEDSSGLMGAIQFNKDGTFYLGGGLLSDSYDNGDYMAACYGTYSFGDDNSTLYLKTDDSCESKVEYLGASWAYEKDADAIAVVYEGYTLTFYKSDAVVRLPEDTAEGSEAEAEAEETASEAEAQASDDADAVSTVSRSTDKYIAALDEYFDYPIEQGYTDDYSYLQKMAQDSEYYYWEYSFGGTHGVVEQSKKKPQKISGESQGDFGSKSSLLVRLLYYYFGESFEFKDIYYNGDTTISYDGQTMDGEKWDFVNTSNQTTEFVFAYYDPYSEDTTDEEEDQGWCSDELTLFYEGVPIAAFDCGEGWPYTY